MANPIEKIMNTKYKFAFVGIIIMIIVFVLGAMMIQGMNNVIVDQGITYTDANISNKYLDESNNHFYIVVGDNNQTFDIQNDDEGTKMYNMITVGQHYKFTIQNDTNSPIMHIIQVYNDTN